MKTRIISFFLISMVFLGCSDCITGKGQRIIADREVGAYTGIQISMPAEVILYTDTSADVPSVQITAQENILNTIDTKVENGVLSIGSDDCLNGYEDVIITLYNPTFDLVHIDGSGNVVSGNTLVSEDFRIIVDGSGDMQLSLQVNNELSTLINGSGNMNLSGEVKEHTIEINGSGDVDSYNLATSKTAIDIDGSGNAWVRVLDHLTVLINGSGDVFYKGNPSETDVTINGSGMVIKQD